VWICPSPQGHLQATGLDSRNRKQYLYHPRWRQLRDETKFDRLEAFGQSLGKLRARVRRDLRKRGYPREKIIATIVRLMQTTLIRIGNEDYARQNGTFGLTTMRNRHATIRGAKVCFHFPGKSGIRHEIDLHDRRLAAIVKGCQELPGQELFQYVDEAGQRHKVTSGDVNSYLQEVMGQDFTAKDFRTWAGTVLASVALLRQRPGHSATETKRNVVKAVSDVAHQLRNTRSVCRRSYIHPAVIDCYSNGSLTGLCRQSPCKAHQSRNRWLSADERVLLMFLKNYPNA